MRTKKTSYVLCFLSGVLLMASLSTLRGSDAPSPQHVYELRMYHVNAGKMDALKARFRDHADRPEELDRESLSQTDSLQSTPERRALRRLGATRAIHAGAARCI